MDAVPSLSDALKNRMSYLSACQAVLAGNIANADTPSYLPRDVVFKNHVAQAGGRLAMAATNGQHMAGSGAEGGSSGDVVTQAVFVQHNGNGVRLDDQMVKMNQTELDYRLMTQIYAKNASLQRIAIGKSQ